VSQLAPTNAEAQLKEAVAFATGLPNAVDVAARLAGNPNVAATFAHPANQTLGLLHQGGGYAGLLGGTSRLSTSTVDFDISVLQLTNPGSILLGFLDPVTTGFDMLRFRANKEGGAIEIDLTFMNSADAIAYFNDQVVVLGDWITTGSDNIMDLQFIFDVTSNDAGANFNTNFLVGNGTLTPIPEPSTYVLFAFGLLGLVVIARRRRVALRMV
jgi:hypothetical protein